MYSCIGIHAVCYIIYAALSSKNVSLKEIMILILTSFQSNVTDLPSSLIIVLTVISTHPIVHTDPDDVCGDGQKSSDTVHGGVGDPILIVLNVRRDIIRIAIFNIVEEIKSSCYERQVPFYVDTGASCVDHSQVADCSWGPCRYARWTDFRMALCMSVRVGAVFRHNNANGFEVINKYYFAVQWGHQSKYYFAVQWGHQSTSPHYIAQKLISL